MLPLITVNKSVLTGKGFSQLERLEIEQGLLRTMLMHSEGELFAALEDRSGSYATQYRVEFWSAARDGYEARMENISKLIDLLNKEVLSA